MMRGVLANLSLATAMICACVVPIALLSDAVRFSLVPPLAWIGGAIAFLLLLRIVFDPKVRRGVDTLNFAMRDRRRETGRRIGMLDPHWGLFGRNGGDGLLLAVRAVAMGEFLLVLLAAKAAGDIAILAFVGAFIAMELSILYAASNVSAGLIDPKS